MSPQTNTKPSPQIQAVQEGKLPPSQGTDPVRQTNNSIARLRSVSLEISKSIEVYNGKNKNDQTDLSNYFKSLKLYAVGSQSEIDAKVSEARTSMQVAAAKTQAEMIETWIKQKAQELGEPKATKLREAFAKFLKDNGVPEADANKGQFARLPNGEIDSHALLGGWYGKLNYRGKDIGILEKFHRENGVIQNITGGCPIQVLKEVTKLLLKLVPEPGKVAPPVIKQDVPINTEGDIPLRKRVNTDPRDSVEKPSSPSASLANPSPNGPLTRNASTAPNLLVAFGLGLLSGPIKDVSDQICRICNVGGGLDGGGFGTGGVDGGTKF